MKSWCRYGLVIALLLAGCTAATPVPLAVALDDYIPTSASSNGE